MKEFQIDQTQSNQRFDKYLKRILPNASMSFFYKMLRKKNITLNNKKADGKEILAEGDLVKVFLSDDTFQKFASVSENMEAYEEAYRKLKFLKIVYEDDHILLVNKNSGVLSQKAKMEDYSLNEWLIGYLFQTKQISADTLSLFKPSILNRLDYNTSGLVICGKSLEGSQKISEILKNRSLQKYYIAFVEGRLEGEKTLTAFHKKDSKLNQASISLKEPEDLSEYHKIVTRYKALEYKNNITKLEVELITGKSHQIRAHLAAIHHPIVGDFKYGSTIAKKDGQLLHCYKLVFPELSGNLSNLSHKEFRIDESN